MITTVTSTCSLRAVARGYDDVTDYDWDSSHICFGDLEASEDGLDRLVHFGLGSATTADTITITDLVDLCRPSSRKLPIR